MTAEFNYQKVIIILIPHNNNEPKMGFEGYINSLGFTREPTEIDNLFRREYKFIGHEPMQITIDATVYPRPTHSNAREDEEIKELIPERKLLE